jgi:hypothetical protein
MRFIRIALVRTLLLHSLTCDSLSALPGSAEMLLRLHENERSVITNIFMLTNVTALTFHTYHPLAHVRSVTRGLVPLGGACLREWTAQLKLSGHYEII